MKQLKFAIAGAGLLGVIATFLPMVEAMGISVSLWDVKSADAGQFFMTFAGYLIGLVVGGMAIVKPPLKKQFTGIAVAGFALSTLKMRNGFDGALGGKLLLIAGVVGLLVCIAALVKPEEE